MARLYAGILGPLAFLTCLARGLLHAWHCETVLWRAWISLWVFAALGGVIGWIAGGIVEQEVRARLSTQRPGQSVPMSH
ncbi:MAG: hypothetical protein ACUVUC_08760 [Thermoguttaceae bacterium]